MRILIDECLPAALKGMLAELGHDCETVRQAGYGSKKNGELLSLAEGRWDIPACGQGLKTIAPGRIVEVGPI